MPEQEKLEGKEFGKHIGGSRRDQWRENNGISLNDLRNMSPAERKAYVIKDNVWPKPDYEKIHERGADLLVLYAQKQIRDAIPSAVPQNETAEKYIEFVSLIRDHCSEMTGDTVINTHAFREFWKKYLNDHGIIDEWGQSTAAYTSLFTYKAWNTCLYPPLTHYRDQIAKEQFCIPKEEKIPRGYRIEKYTRDSQWYPEDGNLKENTFFVVNSRGKIVGRDFATYDEAKKFAKEQGKGKGGKRQVPIPALNHPVRTGLPDYRHGRDISGEDFVKTFGLHGAEAGNYVSDKETQDALNSAYDAYMDMAAVLGIEPKQIGMDGKLSVAFGARGRGGSALAHYEPLYRAINMTKEKGAGSLAHETFHAIDDIIGREVLPGVEGIEVEGGFMTENIGSDSVPLSVQKVYDALMTRPATQKEKDDLQAVREKRDKARALDFIRRISDKVWSQFDRSQMTPGEIRKVEDMVRGIISEKAEPGKFVDSYPSIEAVSDWKRKNFGRGILKETRDELRNLKYWLTEADKPVKVSPDLTVKSDYYNDAVAIDLTYSKSGNGYWGSPCEMFARAGACYITDKLKKMGARDDYLSGHSDPGGVQVSIVHAYAETETRIAFPSPQGEERKAADRAFDDMFRDFRIRGIFISKAERKKIEQKDVDLITKSGQKIHLAITGYGEDSSDPLERAAGNTYVSYSVDGESRKTATFMGKTMNAALAAGVVLKDAGISGSYMFVNSDIERLKEMSQTAALEHAGIEKSSSERTDKERTALKESAEQLSAVSSEEYQKMAEDAFRQTYEKYHSTKKPKHPLTIDTSCAVSCIEGVQKARDVLLEPENFQSYLDVEAKFPTLSVRNAILITAQNPDAPNFSRKKSRESDPGIRLIVPFRSRTMGEDGKCQESVRYRMETVYESESACRVFDEDAFREKSGGQGLKQAVDSFFDGAELSTLEKESLEYILCRRYGLEPDMDFSRMPEYTKGKTGKELGRSLVVIQKTAKGMAGYFDRYLENPKIQEIPQAKHRIAADMDIA